MLVQTLSRRRRMQLSALAAVSSLAIGLTACGGSSTNASSGSAQGIQNKEISIGLSNPSSGPSAVYGAVGNGMVAYFDYINSQGGVDGYRFKTFQVDNQGTVAGGASAIRQILSAKPFAAEVTTTPGFSGAATALAQGNKSIPVFGLASGAVIKKANLPNVFGLYTDYTEESLYGVDYLTQHLGLKKIGLVYDPVVNAGAGQSDPARVSQNGATLVESIAVPSSTTNFAPIVAKLKNAGAQGIEAATTLTETVGIAKAAKAIGYSPTIVAYSGNLDQTFITNGGASVNGIYVDGIMPPVSSSDSSVQRFVTETKKYEPKAVSFLGEIGWNGGAVVTAAIKNVLNDKKPLTWSNFKSALLALHGKQVGLAVVGFSSGSQYAIGNESTFELFRVQGNQFTKVG